MLNPLIFTHTIYFLLASLVIACAPLDRALSHWSGVSAMVPVPVGAMYRFFEVVCSSSVPMLYMLQPPTVPEREDLLSTDGRGIRRPKQKNWRERDVVVPWREVSELAIILLMDWF